MVVGHAMNQQTVKIKHPESIMRIYFFVLSPLNMAL